MREAIEQLGLDVAQQALADLAGRSFGAVAAVDYIDATAGEARGEPHWQLEWRVDCTGEQRVVQLIVLPEFLAMDADLLSNQLAVMLSERVMEGLAGAPD